MKPFLKWPGNKYQIIEKVKGLLPEGKRLIEPFAGSAAVFLNTDYKQNIVADYNEDLINLYKQLKIEGSEFIDLCESLFKCENNDPERYYSFRSAFNTTKDKRLKSALFVYLNKHSYNGLCRYNSKGEFNAPFGKYKKVYFPKTEMLNFYGKAQGAGALFIAQDFRVTMEIAEKGDVVYCDPPYVPISSTANFTSYSSSGFGKLDQEDLAFMTSKLYKKGVHVIISNHNTDYTKQAYSEAKKINEFEVQRYISCNGANRGKASELIAVFSL